MKEIHYKNYSKISELKKMNKIDDQFVFYLESLSLEDLIAIKIESTLKFMNFKLINFPLWKSFHTITSEALLTAVFGVASNNSEAARILGIDLKQYKNYLSKFGYEIKTWERS